MNFETFESSALRKYACSCRKWIWADGTTLTAWLDAHAGCESRWVEVDDNHYVARDVLIGRSAA